MSAHLRPLLLLAIVAALVAGCGGDAQPPAAEAPPATAAATPTIDWARCRIPGATLPVQGKLFVVDGGRAPEGAVPGRESIRRVDVFVPGPVALLLTAKDASVWHVRLAPETQLQAIFAAGEQSQRIAGQRLGTARLEKSGVMGDPCGRYWAQDDATLAEVTGAVFGRPHDALYRMRTGLVVIGGPESFEPDALGPGRETVPR
jgi:hypothetical protein